MATFIGTKKEYHDFIGPKIRNMVQKITLKEKKKANNTCSHCKKIEVELEAAHIHGKQRRRTIEDILGKYEKNGQVIVDIKEIEDEITKTQYPINENFIFLCRKCHAKYDSTFTKEKANQDAEEIKSMNEIFENKFDVKVDNSKNEHREQQEILKVQDRLSRWFKNKEQYNSKILYAFIRLYERNNKVVTVDDLRKESGVNTFFINFREMWNISSHNHGKVFSLNGQYVRLWDKVESLIWDNYRKYNK